MALEKPTLKRQISEMDTFQGNEGTCYAHVCARLMVRNIHEMPNETIRWQPICNKALNTYNIKLNITKKKCGENGYLKICVFLYYYYTALSYSEAQDKHKGGITLRVIENLIKHNYSHVPEELKPLQYKDILNTAMDYFKTFPVTKKKSVYTDVLTTTTPLTDSKQTSLANLILLFLQMKHYIGFSYNGHRNGTFVAHIITIVGYDADTESFICKDSASEKKNTSISVHDIGTDTLHYQGVIHTSSIKFLFLGKYSTIYFFTKEKVLKIAKECNINYHYHDVNPFSKKEIVKIPDIIPEKEHEPFPEIICKKNKDCPSPCSNVTRHKPRTTKYCRKTKRKRT